MRTVFLTPLVCIALASSRSVEESFAPAYRVGGVRVIESTFKEHSEISAVRYFLGDEEVRDPELEDLAETWAPLEVRMVVRYREEILALEQGAPTRVRRSFEQIGRKKESGEEESAESGVLEGASVLLTLDGAGEVQAEVSDDEREVDPLYLRNFSMERSEHTLLPTHAVEQGDTWSLEHDARERFLGRAPSPQWFLVEEGDAEYNAFLARYQDEYCDSEVQVTYAGHEEHEGERCARFDFLVTVEGEGEGFDASVFEFGGLEFEEADVADIDVTANLELSLEGQGRMWFSLEHRWLQHLEFENRMSSALTYVLPFEDGEERWRMETAWTRSGRSEVRYPER